MSEVEADVNVVLVYARGSKADGRTA